MGVLYVMVIWGGVAGGAAFHPIPFETQQACEQSLAAVVAGLRSAVRGMTYPENITGTCVRQVTR